MNHDVRRFAAEALGTFLLVFMGGGAALLDAAGPGGPGPVGVALAFGFAVLLVVYAVGHVSGAHINPAVTVAFWAAGRFPRNQVAPYVGGQLVGAIAAAALLRWMLGPDVTAAATVPRVALPQAFVLELVLTFNLMLVIVAVATDDRVADSVAGIAIGLAVALGALVGGGLTGASMNPARSLGPALVTGVWHAHWLYWAAPVLGAVGGALTYEALRPGQAHSTSKSGIAGVLGPLPLPGAPPAAGRQGAHP